MPWMELNAIKSNKQHKQTLPPMELNAIKSNKQHIQTLPPRRGQIKMKIIKNLVRSAKAISSSAGVFGRRHGEDGASLTSASTTPPIPSGYNSDS